MADMAMWRYLFVLLSLVAISTSHGMRPDYVDHAPLDREAALASSGNRAIPNFDGRPTASATVSDILLFGPRVVFYPAYLASEYLIRQPIRWLGRTAELNNLPILVADLFTFGPDEQVVLFPSFLIDFGFRSSVGIHFTWRRFLFQTHKLKFRAATGGMDLNKVRLSHEMELSKESHFELSLGLSTRPDWIFHGVGPLSFKGDRSRYKSRTRDVAVEFVGMQTPRAKLVMGMTVKSVEFSSGDCCGDPGVESLVAGGQFSSPPRFDSGYTAWLQWLSVKYGGDISRPKDRVGGRADFSISHAIDVSSSLRSNWLTTGGAVTGFVDVTGHARVLYLTVDVSLGYGLGSEPIPFNELPSLGGFRPLPGFLANRLLGESAVASTLEYHWPIASFLDGVVHFALGNAFGRSLEGFRWGLLRKSAGLGIESAGALGSFFGLLVALGSEPFERTGAFNEFRVLLRFSSAF